MKWKCFLFKLFALKIRTNRARVFCVCRSKVRRFCFVRAHGNGTGAGTSTGYGCMLYVNQFHYFWYWHPIIFVNARINDNIINGLMVWNLPKWPLFPRSRPMPHAIYTILSSHTVIRLQFVTSITEPNRTIQHLHRDVQSSANEKCAIKWNKLTNEHTHTHTQNGLHVGMTN